MFLVILDYPLDDAKPTGGFKLLYSMEVPRCRSVRHGFIVQGQKLLPAASQQGLTKQTVMEWSSKKALDYPTQILVPDFLKTASDKQRKLKT